MRSFFSPVKLAMFLALGFFLVMGLSSHVMAKDYPTVDFVQEEFDTFPGQGKTVKPARASWTTGFFLEAIYSRALEHLGYEVEEYKELSAPIFYRSLMQGDVDYWANGWFPLHNEQLPAGFDKEESLVGYVVKKGAVQGYLVSKEHAEKYDITTIEDFKRPEVKEAFDANGDGKADLVACPPGWGCESTIAHQMDAYDLRQHVNLIKATYSASMADAVARYNEGEPIFFYTWTPNWTVNKLVPGEDVVWIGVPEIKPTEGQKPFVDYMTVSGLDGAVTDPLTLGWVPNDIRVAANTQFLENNPAAKKLFELMSVAFSDINKQNEKMFKGEDDQEDVERHATEWIKENKDTWMYWQRKAREAAK
jgi:glycine betaine/proline transport system substrate-binding protein